MKQQKERKEVAIDGVVNEEGDEANEEEEVEEAVFGVEEKNEAKEEGEVEDVGFSAASQFSPTYLPLFSLYLISLNDDLNIRLGYPPISSQ